MTSSKYNVSAHVPPTTASPAGSPSNRYLQSVADRLNNAIQMEVFASGTTSLTNNTATKIAFASTATVDSQGGYASSAYTVQSQGMYQINASAMLDITTAVPTITGGAYPTTPFGYTTNVTLLSSNVTAGTSINVYDTSGFLAGMKIGFAQNSVNGGSASNLVWYTIASVVDAVHVKLTTNTNWSTSNVPANAGIFGVAVPAAPTISSTLVDYWLYIYKNGVEIGQAHTNSLSLNNPTLNIMLPLMLGVGDVITIYAKQNSGSTQTIDAGTDKTWFHMLRLL
jgi:hypothetical protein